MSKIDKTKENIGVSKLDEKTKKDLFNRFVESGGQVVADKKRGGFKDFDREKQKQYRQKIEAHKDKLQRERPGTQAKKAAPKAAAPQKVKIQAAQPPKAGFFSGFINRTIIRFKLLFMGVTDFWGGYYKTGFIEKFNTEYKTALLETQMIYLDLFKQNPGTGKKIIDGLDSLKPIYYEIIEMISAIYDRSTFMLITQAYEEFPDISQRTEDYRDFFTALLKKLYVLRAYATLLIDGFERAVNFQMEAEKNKASSYSSKRKKIRNDVYIIFNKLFPRLYWLFCGYQGNIIPRNDPYMETALGITLDDKPGKRVKGAPVTEVEVPLPGDAAIKADAEAKKETLPDGIKKGLEMMYGLDMKKLRTEYDKGNAFRLVKDSDRVLQGNLLLREFDHEYSLILTTNRIKYTVFYGPGGKVDYRTSLSDLYNELRDCMEALRQYSDILEAYEKTRLDKPVSNVQYIEYSKKLTALEKNKRNIGSQARMTVASFMDKVAAQLKVLIDDMNGAQTIVANPQDILAFDSDIEGPKKLSGKKVYEGIYLTHCYAAALAYRLSAGGDLSGEPEGGAEPLPGEVAAPIDNNASPDRAQVKAKQELTEKEEPKSIIEELNDLI